ncbi:M16 family metallopeptidase [Algoriphagus zhangzhouensis]|uniref:Zinc protease n=1 Tax=Algoriphagus zhangzhouensis TaxID=1073327 RepID=A0A1M7Z400_9BACT|nr:M16 family metallopeptidase [Algoriphagus zhangzhouensis]TDY48329.1 zinc protease [Algoriphagus zhangzhouensis]SHO59376.1 zinc protease [Algoriphagus zhangzhouensis]
MQKITLSFLVLVSLTGISFGQQFTDLSQEVPMDPAFRTGVLPNGLTYYIRENKESEGRASFYIYQNVGAVLEHDNQNGLAHFLEHMAFNGTQTFPGKSMLNMLERHGVQFGKDINAYTSTNETVYNISRVPTENAALVDSCLMVLRDWSNELSLEEEEIDAERGVITEEWRSRYNVGYRIGEQVDEAKYNGTIYAYRNVIGDMEVVKNFEYQALKDFYHDWYRTDLQAISVIGDIDVDAVEDRIVEMFSAIPAVKNPKERPFIVIPDHKEPKYAVATDKEVENQSVSLRIRYENPSDNTIGGLKESYIASFFNALIRARIRELIVKGDAPFLGGSLSSSSLVKGYGIYSVTATSKVGELNAAFEGIYTELQRVLQHGFTEGELERLKTNTLVSAENRYNRRDKITNDSYANSLKRTYLDGISVPDADFSYDFVKEVVAGITVEEVSQFATNFLKKENRVFTIVSPENQENEVPTLTELEEILAKVNRQELSAYEDDVPDQKELISDMPKPGEILNIKQLEDFGAEEWTLSNGAKVVFKHADYQKDVVGIEAVSVGGSSLYEPKDLPSVKGADVFVNSFGIGDFDEDSFKKIMTGKTANSGFNISDTYESVSGSAVSKDIETMLQLIYLRFEAPRFDKERFDVLMKKRYEALENQVETANSIQQDTLGHILANGNPRAIKYDKDYLDQIDFDRIKEIYLDRFSDASDFTFFIVGDIDKEELKPLVEQYIGSIHDIDRTEDWIDHDDFSPKGENQFRIGIPMVEPKGTVYIKMKNDLKYSREQVVYHSILGSILKLRYTESIREKEGGTYGVSVRTDSDRIPRNGQTLNISFQCDPENTDALKRIVYDEIEKVKEGVSEEDLKKVVFNIKKNTEDRMENNSYWLRALKSFYQFNEDITSSAYLDDILDKVSSKDIQNYAKKFFKRPNIVDVIFYPEGTEDKTVAEKD